MPRYVCHTLHLTVRDFPDAESVMEMLEFHQREHKPWCGLSLTAGVDVVSMGKGVFCQFDDHNPSNDLLQRISKSEIFAYGQILEFGIVVGWGIRATLKEQHLREEVKFYRDSSKIAA